MAHRDEIVRFLDALLAADTMADVCPNGLQVEGREEVRKVCAAVSADLETIERAVAAGADLLVVHHGLFWTKSPHVVRGNRRRRLKTLLENDVSLLAYHLPLDCHPDLGNNARLAAALGLLDCRPFGSYQGRKIGVAGRLPAPMPVAGMLGRVREALGPEVFYFPGGPDPVERVGIVSGGAAGLIGEAAEAALHVYITGEASLESPALAEEEGIHFLALGHHRTERPGPMALLGPLASSLGVETAFIDVDRPL